MKPCACGRVCSDMLSRNGYCMDPRWRMTKMGTKLTQSVTTEETITTEVAPELSARLAALVSTYNDLKLEADLLYEAMDIEKAKMFELLKTNEIEKVQVEGTALAIVRGFSQKLDKVKFVQLGGSLAQLDNATTKKPKKAYLRIGAEKAFDEAA